jgi:hypothetical protein
MNIDTTISTVNDLCESARAMTTTSSRVFIYASLWCLTVGRHFFIDLMRCELLVDATDPNFSAFHNILSEKYSTANQEEKRYLVSLFRENLPPATVQALLGCGKNQVARSYKEGVSFSIFLVSIVS